MTAKLPSLERTYKVCAVSGVNAEVSI